MGSLKRSFSRAAKVAAKKKRRRTFVRIELTPQIINLDGTPIEQTSLPPFLDPPEQLQKLSSADHHKYERVGNFMKLKDEFRQFLTLKSVITGALLHTIPDEDKGLSKEQIMERGHLAMCVHNAKDRYDFNVDELSLLKDLIKRRWGFVSPIIVAQAFEMIDPKEPEKEVEKLSAVA